MRFDDRLPAILAGTAISSAMVITLPPTAVALTGVEVNEIARAVTVLIVGETKNSIGHGSGAIIAKDGDTYYVLTNQHVVSGWDKMTLVAPDKQAYEVNPDTVKPLPGVDLAVVEFTSKKEYQVAKLANSQLAKEGQDVFISGWPEPGSTGQLIRQFTDGRISGFLDRPVEGYQMIYTNVTRRGMSGGPVLDAGGRVIAIHGWGDYEDSSKLTEIEGMTDEAAANIARLIKPGFNYAIPINTYLQLAPQAGIYLGVKVENSAAPGLGEPYVSQEPDSDDVIDDLNDTLSSVNRVLNTVNDGANTIRRICGLFGC
ncbi:MAG TPA: serine protease [Cyanobacteria bacterium UBA8803]|nr:serine protease [Cyanobacteria bacterium UBA9273]HBL61445.1 serine protease [Cyanobacteria bacterium UBA8803]